MAVGETSPLLHVAHGHTYPRYARRWLMLLIIVLLQMSNAMVGGGGGRRGTRGTGDRSLFLLLS